MAILDIAWLGVIAKDIYARGCGHLMAEKVRWGAAILFYLIYAAGILRFAVAPANSLGGAAREGALLGLLVYAVYDLTNLAILRGWPVGVSILDVAWGTVATSLVAAAVYRVWAN
jgi:uncharacterized membrane protein